MMFFDPQRICHPHFLHKSRRCTLFQGVSTCHPNFNLFLKTKEYNLNVLVLTPHDRMGLMNGKINLFFDILSIVIILLIHLFFGLKPLKLLFA